MNALGLTMVVSRPVDVCGRGIIGGMGPDADGVDGRLRKLNQPFRGRVLVIERSTLVCCASVMSDANGQWLVTGLSPDCRFMVIGVDTTGGVNSAIQDWVQPYVES